MALANRIVEMSSKAGFETVEHHGQLCVVGDGLAGMCAAVSATRKGVQVLLMQDRPVLGGNASSEIRMWIRGASGKDMRKTGLLEEIALENAYRNPQMNFSVWDSILWEKVAMQQNLTLLLNGSCLDAQMNGKHICSVTGWQTTTQQYHKVYADIFADCSGDSVLAALTGATYRMGRESCEEYSEDIAPQQADRKTRGRSCLMQVRETDHPVSFTPTKWATHYTKQDFEHRIDFSNPKKWTQDNFWWMEIGGTSDTIRDTEQLRNELIKMAYAVWDFIKNSGELPSQNWDLEWIGFLPGKKKELPSVMKAVHITADCFDTAVLLDGEERGEQQLWVGELCREVVVTLDKAQPVQTLRMVLDSDLNRTSWQSQKWYVKCYPMVCNRFLNDQPVTVPATLLKEFSVYVDEGDGLWKFLYNEDNNYQRLVNIPINRNVKAAKLLPTEHGVQKMRGFSASSWSKIPAEGVQGYSEKLCKQEIVIRPKFW